MCENAEQTTGSKSVSLPNSNGSPGRVRTIPTGYLNCPPEKEHVVSQVVLPLPRVFPEGLPRALSSIKTGLFLKFDLIW